MLWSCCPVVVIVCVLERVLCSSRNLCFVCDPMFLRVPSRYLSCITCDYWVWYVGDVLYAVCYVCICGDNVYVGYGDVLEVFIVCILRSCISVLMTCIIFFICCSAFFHKVCVHSIHIIQTFFACLDITGFYETKWNCDIIIYLCDEHLLQITCNWFTV